jgi:acetoin utilization deacetylase AcuC-like enzyme
MIVYSEKYLEHNKEYHPENNQRLRSIMNLLTKKDVFEKVPLVEPYAAREEDILKVHTKEHLEFIKAFSGRMVDADTYVTNNSYETALLAAGGILTCVDSYRDYDYSFALVRPPGHHAETNRAMGFCLFNNVAMGARHAMDKFGLKRIFILDFDVHHGNGTQEIFHSTPEVLFFSIHQHPLYPGTGSLEESRRHIIDVPFPPGTADDSYLRAIDEIAMPVMREFKPELVFISAGYDGHYSDPLGGMNLTSRCYYEISKRLVQDKIRAIFTLEGGYNLDALARSVYASMTPIFGLEEEPLEESLKEDERVTEYINSKLRVAKKRISEYWNL